MNKKQKTDQENKDLCRGCDDCCRYIAVEIDRPTTKIEYENIYWFLMHENVNVSIGFDNKWYLEFKTKCKALKNKNCAIYLERPQMCRDYIQEECTHYNDEPAEKILFENAEQFKKYLNKKNKKKKGKASPKRK